MSSHLDSRWTHSFQTIELKHYHILYVLYFNYIHFDGLLVHLISFTGSCFFIFWFLASCFTNIYISDCFMHLVSSAIHLLYAV
uniref:Uncharacterized protein n=1 Tax=Arundo donax TaxID=35708 RepID=A0A0A9EF02_ARUDO